MVLRADWHPEQVGAWEQRWTHARLPTDGTLAAAEAARLQIVFAAMAEELGDLVAQAIYYEETAKSKLQHRKTSAYLTSEAKTDKGKEADAINDPWVRAMEEKYNEAKAYRKLLEGRHESSIRSHYAARAIADSVPERERMAAWS